MDVVPKKKWQYPIAVERDYAKWLVAYVDKEMEIVESFLLEMADSVYRNSIRQDAIGDWLGNLVDKVGRAIKQKLSALPVINRTFKLTDRHVKEQLNGIEESLFGVRTRRPYDTHQLEMIKTIWTSQNLALIKSIDQQVLDGIRYALSQRIIRTVGHDQTVSDLADDIQRLGGVTRKRAMLIAVDQVGKLHSQIANYRQFNSGIERYIWVTRLDNRVRPRHKVRHGVSYRWDSPPPDGHPGWPIRCRCVAQPLYNLDSFKLTPRKGTFTENEKRGIMAVNINGIGEARIPVAKITQYVLHPENSKGKDVAFKSALGYDQSNAMKLIENVERNINSGVITERPQTKYGKPMQIALKLTGPNGKTANVITGWIADAETNEVRLTSIYVKSPK